MLRGRRRFLHLGLRLLLLLLRQRSPPGDPVEHVLGRLQVDDPHDNLGLEEGVGQLRVVEEQLFGLFRVMLDAPLHLLHELKHLLGGQAGHCLGDGLWSCLRWDLGPVNGWLVVVQGEVKSWV